MTASKRTSEEPCCFAYEIWDAQWGEWLGYWDMERIVRRGQVEVCVADELVPVDSIVDNHLGESAMLQGYVESGGKAVGSSCRLGMTACCTGTRLILIPFKAKYLAACE
jgi:hypothetical protein